MTTAPWPCTRPQVLGKLNIPLGQLDVEHAEDETAILDEPRWNQVRGELLFNAVSVSVPQAIATASVPARNRDHG